MNTKTALVTVIMSVMVAVAVAPTMTGKGFASTVVTGQTCTNGGGQPKDCNGGSPSIQCTTTTTKSGLGMGGGESKTTTTDTTSNSRC